VSFDVLAEINTFKVTSNEMDTLSVQRRDRVVGVCVLSFCCVSMLLHYLLVVALSVDRYSTTCPLKVPLHTS